MIPINSVVTNVLRVFSPEPTTLCMLRRCVRVLCFVVLFAAVCADQAHAAPNIGLMTPFSGPVGAVVQIFGSGFGTSQGTSTVKFNGTPVTWVSWSASSLIVMVPVGATSGNVIVTVGGVASSGKAFTVTPPPAIFTLSTGNGSVGSSLTITGTGFTGGGTWSPQVMFNPFIPVNATTYTDSSITVTVPAGATSGDIAVDVGGGYSNAVLFMVTSTGPSISNVSPDGGAVGTSITISGSNFGSTQGNSTVSFNGTTSTSTSWSPTTIVVPVPSGATAGNIVVSVGGVASNGYGFAAGTAAPQITSVSPTSGAVGTSVTINGTNFGTTQGTSIVTFNQASGIPSSWSATSIKVPVPSGATTGSVVVSANVVVSNAVNFVVPGTGPSVANLSLSSGPAGTLIIITGANFGPLQGNSTVTFNGVAAVATNWSATSVSALVPLGATSGNVVVTANGTTSNGVNFTVTANITGTPSITAVSPTSGPLGALVTMTGSNFGATQGTSTVKFNGTAGLVVSWSSSQIVALVPSGASTGPVIVAGNGLSSNAVTFTVTAAPAITSLSPASGLRGQLVTIGGSGFGSNQQAGIVYFNGSIAAPTSWNNSSIQVPVPPTATSGNVLVSLSGVLSNGVAFTVPPAITSVFPVSGAPGASVTIFGHDFGNPEPSGSSISVNAVPCTVTYWSAGSIAFTLPSNATSGQLVVHVGSVATNGVPFTIVPAPSVSTVSPPTGTAGTTVTIRGSGFGSTQGRGSLMLGSTYGVVTSWSDTQITAAVASGAQSGSAQVTQGGVASNAVAFTAITPVVTNINTTTGTAGTPVTITGTGFGTTRGSGNVRIGSTYGIVSSWSDTQIVASVASTAQTGTLKVLQGGVWSNALQFTVPPTNHSVTITPSMINMVVGQTSNIQALNSTGATVSGLTWQSSNTAIVSISTSDPPTLTALAPGHVTITASDGVADVIVSSIPVLPPGTINWSIPGDGSGVTQIIPAVPSATGVADVFAVQASGNVLAVTSDGIVAWSATVPSQDAMMPDFLGGLIVIDSSTIKRLDGLTGQISFTYTLANPCVNVGTPWSEYVTVTVCDANQHPRIGLATDGTIFTIDGDSVIGLEPTTGATKFSIHLEHTFIQQYAISIDVPSAVPQIVVAGDGYAYIMYRTDFAVTINIPNFQSGNGDEKLRILRVGASGDSTTISLADLVSIRRASLGVPAFAFATGFQGTGTMIPNGPNGVIVSWIAAREGYSSGGGSIPTYRALKITGINGGGIASDAVVDSSAYDGWVNFTPLLQKADGTLVGTGAVGPPALQLLSCDQSGNCTPIATTPATQGNPPTYQPIMATADGGVIAKTPDGTIVTYNSSAAPTSTASLAVQSWGGNVYQQGSLDKVATEPILPAMSLWANSGGNPSGTGTAARPWYFMLVWQNDFSFVPSYPNLLTSLQTDITNHATEMKTAALKELKDAYSGVPVTVVEGAPGTGDHRAIVLDHQNLVNGSDCGATNPNVPHPSESQVDYINNMENAQIALQVVINNAQDEANALNRHDLIQAIGRGIGVSAAHEIAHHFLFLCCDMDANPQSDTNARGTFNATGCYAPTDPSPWTGYWPTPKIDLHWEDNGPPFPTALEGLGQCLGSGWRDFGGSSCHN
jgi:hypothetical protein